MIGLGSDKNTVRDGGSTELKTADTADIYWVVGQFGTGQFGTGQFGNGQFGTKS